MQFFHVLSRGVEKRNIFLDRQDYLRYIHDLYEFNDRNSVSNVNYRFIKSNLTHGIVYHNIKRRPRKRLVEIHIFCLMPNHYHLLVQSGTADGVAKFMQKVNAGYAKYFNTKYDRTGTLFERRYRSIPIEREAHFAHLPYYIHLNPLDLKFPEWRERRVRNVKAALSFLASYRWSSHLDYLGQKNFPSVTQRTHYLEFFNGPWGYEQAVADWLRTPKIREFHGIHLE